MNFFCIFGHKWDDGQYKKNCKRKNCLAFKTLMEYPYSGKFGQSVIKWKKVTDGEIRYMNR